MPDQKIIDYIRTSRTVNIPDDKITTTLLEKKYKEEEIEEAFKHLDSKRTKFNSIGKGMWDLVIIIVVGIIILAAGILLVTSPSKKKFDKRIPRDVDITSQSEPTQTPTMQPTLVGEWNFEEGKGSTTNDTSGNGNTGTIYGATWTNGKTGKALQFNGPTDYVDVGNGESLNIANTVTIEAWIKPSSIANYPSIVNNSGYNFQIGANSGDGRVVLEKQGVAYLVIARTPLFANQWYHVAATYEGTIAKIYINGKLNAQNTAANYNLSTTANTLIGYYPGGVGNFNGIIDDVHIYNYARTLNQIESDYNQALKNSR